MHDFVFPTYKFQLGVEVMKNMNFAFVDKSDTK